MNRATLKHLTAERTSAVLDEPWKDKDGQAHLERCEECRTEFERLSRMRMALSALPEVHPPAGHWVAIEAALDSRSHRPNQGMLRFRWRTGRPYLVFGPLQLAAALVLFAGGVFAGLQLTGPVGVVLDNTAQRAMVSTSDEDQMLLDGLTRLESLRAPVRQASMGDRGMQSADGWQRTGAEAYAAVERVAQLEGFIRAMRERLEGAPGDVVASTYLLEAVDERDRLADDFRRAREVVTW